MEGLYSLYAEALRQRNSLTAIAQKLGITPPQKVTGSFGLGWNSFDLFTMGQIIDVLMHRPTPEGVRYGMLEMRKDLNTLLGVEKPLTNISFQQLRADLMQYLQEQKII